MLTCLMNFSIQFLLKVPLTQIILITLRTSDVPTPLTELNFTQYDVYDILAGLDVTKTTGIDGIGPRILKNCALPLCHPLHELFQKCLQ